LVQRARFYDLLSVLATAVVVVLATAYAEIVYVYDLTTLVVCVILPLVLGSLFMYARKSRVMLYAFLSIIWAALDDRPIFFDSVLTWPEVTRFHPFIPRLLMNVIIHGLTLVFLYLAVREASKGSRSSFWRAPRVLVPAFAFLVFAYLQNLPLAAIQDVVQAGANPASWYPFDLVSKVLAVACLFVTLKEASRLKAHGPGKRD